MSKIGLTIKKTQEVLKGLLIKTEMKMDTELDNKNLKMSFHYVYQCCNVYLFRLFEEVS